MAEQEQVEISGADVESLAGKLEALAAGLNEQEQAILSHVLRTAAESANEVSGFAAIGFTPGIAFDIAGAVGIRDVSGKVKMHDFHFVKTVDKASPTMMQ